MKDWLRQYFLPFLVYWFYQIWSFTWKITVHESAQMKAWIADRKPYILAVWHGDEIAVIAFATRYHLASMASTSKDGDIMNNVMNRFGIVTSRGSSTRGGARALIGLIRLMRTGRAGVVAVDGPKGPYHEPKPGVFDLSRHSQCSIIPGVISCSNKIVFERSWNKTYLPKLFSHVHLEWGDPMPPISENADPRDPKLSTELKQRLEALATQSESRRLQLS